LFVKYSCATK